MLQTITELDELAFSPVNLPGSELVPVFATVSTVSVRSMLQTQNYNCRNQVIYCVQPGTRNPGMLLRVIAGCKVTIGYVTQLPEAVQAGVIRSMCASKHVMFCLKSCETETRWTYLGHRYVSSYTHNKVAT